MSAGAIVRADWSGVTLGEYSAHAILASADALTHMNAYWDDIAVHDLCGDGTPNRLTDDGAAWLCELQAAYESANDERDVIRMGREFVREFGTMLVSNVARSIRGAR